MFQDGGVSSEVMSIGELVGVWEISIRSKF